MSPSRWRIAAASAIGTSHIKAGLTCQDSFLAKILSDGNNQPVIVVVISDGAGSADRSDVGSWLTCSTVVEAVEMFLADGGRVEEVTRDIVKSWISLVQQAVIYRAGEDGAVPRDYASTMLFALVGLEAAAFGQIGDGAIVVSDDGDDGWAWVHWPQRGQFANTTFFVTSEDAQDRLAFDLSKRRIDEVAMFSDGIEALVLHYATKTVHAPFFARMFPAVRASPNDGLDRGLCQALETYLGSAAICERTDDDKTLVLATRRASLLPAEVVDGCVEAS